MNPVKERKWIYILISILIAFTFWLFVRTGEDPEMENRVKGIAVQVSGDRVLENQGLMVDGLSHETISLTWKGSWSVIGQLDKNNVSVTVDVSRISEPGTYDLNYLINYPSTVAASTVSLQNSDPEQITVTVSKIYSNTFEIRPLLKGRVKEGSQAGKIIVEPETVLISGTQEKVDRIDRVQVVLEQKELSETFAGELPLRLLDADGKELDHTGLTFSVDKPYVVVPVVVAKEVPLTVDFIAGGGATEKNADYTITPATITVSGPEEEIRNLEEISLGSIDLAQVMGTYTSEFPIYLPSGFENISGISNAKVEVVVSGLTTKAIEVENIELINVPKGCKATLATQVRTIVLRGPESALSKVYASQIKIVADLTELASATGSYNVPAKVYLYTSSDVGVIGQNNIVVNLTRR